MPGLKPDPTDELYRRLRNMESRLSALENRRSAGLPMFAVASDVSQSYPSTSTAINFTGTMFDSHNVFDISTDVLTIPYSGAWWFSLNTPGTFPGTGSVAVVVSLFNTGGGVVTEWHATLSEDDSAGLWTVAQLDAGDTLQLKVSAGSAFQITNRVYMTWRFAGELIVPVPA